MLRCFQVVFFSLVFLLAPCALAQSSGGLPAAGVSDKEESSSVSTCGVEIYLLEDSFQKSTKLQAIKLIHQYFKLGLAEAKNTVESEGHRFVGVLSAEDAKQFLAHAGSLSVEDIFFIGELKDTSGLIPLRNLPLLSRTGTDCGTLSGNVRKT